MRCSAVIVALLGADRHMGSCADQASSRLRLIINLSPRYITFQRGCCGVGMARRRVSVGTAWISQLLHRGWPCMRSPVSSPCSGLLDLSHACQSANPSLVVVQSRVHGMAGGGHLIYTGVLNNLYCRVGNKGGKSSQQAQARFWAEGSALCVSPKCVTACQGCPLQTGGPFLFSLLREEGKRGASSSPESRHPAGTKSKGRTPLLSQPDTSRREPSRPPRLRPATSTSRTRPPPPRLRGTLPYTSQNRSGHQAGTFAPNHIKQALSHRGHQQPPLEQQPASSHSGVSVFGLVTPAATPGGWAEVGCGCPETAARNRPCHGRRRQH